MAVNVWLMSEFAYGLSTTVCRGWFSTSFVIQLICTTLVSVLISFRLWAWYGMSSLSLYILSFVWIISFAGAFGLLINFIWAHDYLIYDVYFNTCTSVAPELWKQWLPATLEHGFYFCFLLMGAISTPRSAQTPALAVLYRDGIVFYLLTFITMLGALLDWAVASRLWVGMTLYVPWIVFQVAFSRLLLDVKTSEVFEKKREESSLPRTASPLQEFAMTRSVDTKHLQREKHMHSPMSYHMNDISRPSFHPKDHDDDHHTSDRGSTVQSQKSHRRFWWLFRRPHSSSRDIHVDILADDELGADNVGGVKDSRLGRFDSWLW